MPADPASKPRPRWLVWQKKMLSLERDHLLKREGTLTAAMQKDLRSGKAVDDRKKRRARRCLRCALGLAARTWQGPERVGRRLGRALAETPPDPMRGPRAGWGNRFCSPWYKEKRFLDAPAGWSLPVHCFRRSLRFLSRKGPSPRLESLFQAIFDASALGPRERRRALWLDGAL